MEKKSLIGGVLLALSASTLYASVISADAPIGVGGEKIGVAYKGANVTCDGASCKIQGSVVAGNEYMLFYDEKDKIKLARLDRAAVKNYKVLKEFEDSYGVKWKKVELDFTMFDASLLKEDGEDVWAAEKELFERCGSCHASKKPEEFTINQWPNIIKTMSDRAGLNKDETRQVGSYMQYILLNMQNKTK